MKRSPIVVGILAAIVGVLAYQAAAQPQVDEQPATWRQLSRGGGETLYAELCAVCHGTDARGEGPAAPALATPVPDLTQLAVRNGGDFPEARVEKTITGETEIAAHGDREMPMWGKVFLDARPDHKYSQRTNFARTRIQELVAYLETLQGQQAAG